MEIRKMCILEAIQFKGATIFCQIRVEPRSLMYFHGQRKTHRTHRWMQTEHWAQFDAKLEGILEQNTFQAAMAKGDVAEKHFKLNGDIKVRVKNSQTPSKVLSDCLGTQYCSEDNHDLVLDCVIGISNHGKFEHEKNKSPNPTEYVPTAALSSTASTPSISVAYMTYIPSPKKETHTYTASASESILPCSVVPQESKYLNEGSVEPYSPMPSGMVNYPSYSATAESTAAVLETVEPYSPKPLREQRAESRSSPAVPLYYPIRIEKALEFLKNGDKEPTTQSDCGKTNKKEKLNRKREHSKQTDNASNTPVIVENILSGIERQKGLEKAERINSETKVKKKVRIVQVSGNNEATESAELRRSQRATVPSKHNTNKKVSKKLTALDKNLFGSDDDDDDDEISYPSGKGVVNELDPLLVADTGYGSKTNFQRSPKSAGEKKEQLIKVRSQYTTSKVALSEMNTGGIIQQSSLDDKTTSITAKKYRAKPMQIEKETEKYLNLNKALEKCLGTASDEFKMLSLDDMSSSDILQTFMDHKETLDAVFQAVKRKNYIHSYNGVNHYLVMELTTKTNQLDMMNHLDNIYRHDFKCGSSSLAQLLVNALLPEWIVRIFMHKFKMTRQETIQQLKAQENFKLNMEAELDNTLRLE